MIKRLHPAGAAKDGSLEEIRKKLSFCVPTLE
jgi:hypothetical protein